MKSHSFRALFFIFSFLAITGQDYLHAQSNEDKAVSITSVKRSDGQGYDLYATNKFHVEVFLSATFPQLRNLTSSQPLPHQQIIPPTSSDVYLLSLTIQDAKKGYGYKLSYAHAYGNPENVQPDDYLYYFPFAHGTKHKISQGFLGTFSHQNENSYAVDFNFDVGTEIYAARPGTVVEVKKDSNIGGRDVRYASFTNFILIVHSDGTFGNYVHLQYNGSFVVPGDTVEVGQLIGLSGNTGISTGPHLHFDVRVPTLNGKMQSIPIAFRGPNDEEIIPEVGRYYYAHHPGQPPFPITFGRDLQHSNFSTYSRAIPHNDAFETRSEQVDDSYIVYLQNGHDTAFDVSFDMTMRNMTASVEFPLNFIIPAKTELFVSILHAIPGKQQISYAPRISYREISQGR